MSNNKAIFFDFSHSKPNEFNDVSGHRVSYRYNIYDNTVIFNVNCRSLIKKSAKAPFLFACNYRRLSLDIR